MSDSTYNGWTNWDTWATALWVDNDQPLNKQKELILRAANKYKAKGKYNESKLRKALNRLAKKGALIARKGGDEVSNKKVNWKEIEDNWISDLDNWK